MIIDPVSHVVSRTLGGVSVGRYEPGTGKVLLGQSLGKVAKQQLKAALEAAGLEVKGFGKWKVPAAAAAAVPLGAGAGVQEVTVSESEEELAEARRLKGAGDPVPGARAILPELVPGQSPAETALATGSLGASTPELGGESQVLEAGGPARAAADSPAPAAEHEIPPCPLQDPRAGDKTPAVIAWYREHHPAEYARRYAGRRFGNSVIQ